MIRAVDDLGTPPSRGSGGSGVAQGFALLVAFVGVVAVSLLMERSVARNLASAGGRWSFEASSLPEWFPAAETGILDEIERLPEEVPLRTATWRERVAAALERSAWIERVDEVTRTADGIEFTARFLRPVMAVRDEDGYLLIDSAGRVIDRQAGRELHPSWGVPEYIIAGRDWPPLSPGTRIEDPEFEECLSLVRVLWEHRTFERFPGAIPAIDAYTQADTPGVLWRLHSSTGVALYWGRAPASVHISARPAEEKVRTLEEVLRLGDRIRGAGGITLHGPEPIVVGRL